MKELAEDFKTIWKKDRNLIWWMTVNFLLSVWLFLIPLFSLNPNKAKVWARYSDISGGYAPSDWWYLLSFSLIGFVIGVGHTFISARLYTKRGKDIARLILGVSVMVCIIGISFLLNIVGEG